MITDESQRYALAQLDERVLWRYDRRWRSFHLHEPAGGRPFSFFEGLHHGVVVTRDPDTGEIETSVRSPADPTVAVATGTYSQSWQVNGGDNRAWALVPEYVLIPLDDGRSGLLRIADDAEVDPLDGGFGEITTVAQVPDSRLVILAGGGAYTVYDPVAHLAIRHYELKGANPTPTLRFRSGDELWLNDVETMLKIETRQFDVIDAAGSEPLAELSAGASDTDAGEFGKWSFAAGNELCVVARPRLGDVLVLDAVSMLPVARAQFPGKEPIDAVMVGRNMVIALDRGGRPLQRRVKRVGIKFET